MKSFIAVVVAAMGCSAGEGQVSDCAQIAADNASCMPQSAIDDCEAAHDDCADGGEVLTAESCPLQFNCSP